MLGFGLCMVRFLYVIQYIACLSHPASLGSGGWLCSATPSSLDTLAAGPSRTPMLRHPRRWPIPAPSWVRTSRSVSPVPPSMSAEGATPSCRPAVFNVRRSGRLARSPDNSNKVSIPDTGIPSMTADRAGCSRVIDEAPRRVRDEVARCRRSTCRMSRVVFSDHRRAHHGTELAPPQRLFTTRSSIRQDIDG